MPVVGVLAVPGRSFFLEAPVFYTASPSQQIKGVGALNTDGAHFKAHPATDSWFKGQALPRWDHHGVSPVELFRVAAHRKESLPGTHKPT